MIGYFGRIRRILMGAIVRDCSTEIGFAKCRYYCTRYEYSTSAGGLVGKAWPSASPGAGAGRPDGERLLSRYRDEVGALRAELAELRRHPARGGGGGGGARPGRGGGGDGWGGGGRPGAGGGGGGGGA